LAKHLLYMIGYPGAGKTTLMEAALEGVPWAAREKPFAHRIYPGGIQLGAAKERFGGTDTLSMAVMPEACAFLSSTTYKAMVGEGDRLSSDRFFEEALQWGWEIAIVYLALPEATASRRREHRGSNQNAQWVRGRETKVLALVDRWKRRESLRGTKYVHELDGTKQVSELARELRHFEAMRALARRP
jgi:hypothetical protein